MSQTEENQTIWQRFKQRLERLSLWLVCLCFVTYFAGLSYLSLSPVMAFYTTLIVGIFMVLQQLCLAWFDMPVDGTDPFDSRTRYRLFQLCFIGAALVFIATGILSAGSYRALVG